MAAEGGVVPLVADLTDVGAVDSTFIARTPDAEVGVWRLLAREGGDGRPLVSFEIEIDVIVDVRADRVLTDGRPVEIDGEGRDAWIRTVAEQGHSVAVVAPTLDVDDTLAVVDGVVVDGDELVRVPDGWVEAGSVPIPSWIDGHTTDYVLVDGRRCSILVERRRGDREALARFGPTAPVDLGTGDWAYRIEAAAGSSLGYVFEYGDDLVVNVTGDLTDPEFRAVIASLRELRPGETVILEPGASSSA